ncbi:MAG: hypothetical protein RIS70_862 [Planctomycetota bacterium]
MKLASILARPAYPRRYRSMISFIAIAALFTAVFTTAWAQTKGKPRRAKPPTWDEKEVRKIFFENIFDGNVLVGDRPADMGVASKAKPNGGGGSGNGGGAVASGASANPSASGGAGGGGSWSTIIAGSTIEDEVKAIRQGIDESVTTPTDFAGKGYKTARMHFTVLAMLFGIASEYESDVRWKNDAPRARDAFARAAANAKAGGNSQVYAEAKNRKQDLQELVGGSGFPGQGNAEAKTAWDQTCGRSPLMQRLEVSQDSKMKTWTADKATFKANKEQFLHEAQLVAAIGEVLTKEGMEDADTPEYRAFCLKLKQAALDAVEAVKLDNDDQARKAVSDINKSCDDCHASYRS